MERGTMVSKTFSGNAERDEFVALQNKVNDMVHCMNHLENIIETLTDKVRYIEYDIRSLKGLEPY